VAHRTHGLLSALFALPSAPSSLLSAQYAGRAQVWHRGHTACSCNKIQ
jgi:hypothetical protein